MTRDRQIDVNGKPAAAAKENPAVLNYFRQPSKLIRTDGIVATTSKSIVMGYKNDVDKAKAIYEWIVDNTFRDAKVKGCGIGDISTMLESGYLGGKCADLNALYVGLARAAGLPARDVYGMRVAASSEFKSLGGPTISPGRSIAAPKFISMALAGCRWILPTCAKLSSKRICRQSRCR